MTNWPIPSEGQRRVVVRVPGYRPGPSFPRSDLPGSDCAGELPPRSADRPRGTGGIGLRLGGEGQVLRLRNLCHLDLKFAT